ncbi:acyl-CoA thioesterase [Actinokineospora sp. G85]|uniref:acyl-CoA thioesterase n=1 Tax=Actinokineospora sp. G85 TaxID=3406626 RepID=UPI003C756654
MPLQVRYHECDQQGVVFNAHYLAYADMACTAALKALFGSYGAVLERGVDLVVAESTIRYLAPCRFDDELVVVTSTEKVGTTSLVLRFTVRNGETTAAEIVTRYVWVGTESHRPVAPPDDIRAAFTA